MLAWHFVFSSIDRKLGYFPLLASVNNAGVAFSAQLHSYLFKFFLLCCTIPGGMWTHLHTLDPEPTTDQSTDIAKIELGESMNFIKVT